MDDGAVRTRRHHLQGISRRRCMRAASWSSSGGFQANLDWMRQYWGDAVDNFVIRGTPYNRGRVLKNLLDQGVASVGDPTQCHAVALDARAPKFDGGITTRLDSVPYSIVVNRDGERFYDEGEDVWPKRYAIWGRLIAQQPGQIAYSICDREVRAAVHAVGLSGGPSRHAGRTGRTARPRPVEAPRDGCPLQPRGPPRQRSTTPRLDGCATEGLEPPKTNWARTDRHPAFHRLSAAAGNHLHLSRRAGERSRRRC